MFEGPIDRLEIERNFYNVNTFLLDVHNDEEKERLRNRGLIHCLNVGLSKTIGGAAAR